jgi:arylsulfatase A-like enzyme
VVIDTLRADHLGAYGYERPTSPTIDGLATRGVVFTRATSPSSWTKPAVGSLFTSRLPSEHGAVGFGRPLDGKLPTLAEALRDAGYHTVGFSGNFVHVNREAGFARGFDVFEQISRRTTDEDALIEFRVGDGPAVPLRAPRADELTDVVLEGLPPAQGAPLFLYVHYMDPHSGYEAPEPFRRRFLRDIGVDEETPPATSDHVADLALTRAQLDAGERVRLEALYDAEIAYVDSELARLLRGLEERGYAEDAVVVVTADHGEEFGDHGGWFHGLTLYGEVLHLPLVLTDLRERAEPVRRDEPVDLLDLAPTLLALAGADPPADMRGRELFAASTTARTHVAELFPDPLSEQRIGPQLHRVALTQWPWKALAAPDGSVSLYQLERDPLERRALAAGAGEAPAGLVELARGLAAREALGEREGELDLTDETREALRALGYAR